MSDWDSTEQYVPRCRGVIHRMSNANRLLEICPANPAITGKHSVTREKRMTSPIPFPVVASSHFDDISKHSFHKLQTRDIAIAEPSLFSAQNLNSQVRTSISRLLPMQKNILTVLTAHRRAVPPSQPYSHLYNKSTPSHHRRRPPP